jgi:hypothetical protein
MRLFRRAKPADPTAIQTATNAPRVSGKITLNFGRRTDDLVRSIAAATLESGGFKIEVAMPKDPDVGDKMPDGTIYAGLSPDTGKPIYTTPADASLTMEWNEAMDYTSKLDAHGHQDWCLPSKDELNALFNNRAAIGGFNVSGSEPAGWYWSGTQTNYWGAWGQRFSDGCQYNNFTKDYHPSVRCVRGT